MYMRIPLKRPKKTGKGCFCTTRLCKFTAVFELKIYNLLMFSRPSNIKYSFICSNFVLFRIIRIVEVYSKHSRTFTMELFAKIFKGFCWFHRKPHLRYLTGLWMHLWIVSFSVHFASLNLSSLYYCINKKNSS